jgi:hypothetical protein
VTVSFGTGPVTGRLFLYAAAAVGRDRAKDLSDGRGVLRRPADGAVWFLAGYCCHAAGHHTTTRRTAERGHAMQFHHTSTLRSRTLGRRPLLIAGAALLAVAALGTWQSAGSRDHTRAPAVEHSPAVVAAPVAQTPATTPGSEAVTTIYLVDSAEQAAVLQAKIRDGNQVFAQFGQPEFSAQVVVVGSAEEEAVLRGQFDSDGALNSPGLPHMAVIDLRNR